MAVTAVATGNALTNQLWARGLQAEVVSQMTLGGLLGKGSTAVVEEIEELKKAPGDRVTRGLRAQLTGAGQTGNSTLEGNEEALTFYNDTLYIDQQRHAVRTYVRMDDQRINTDLREECKLALSDWFAPRMDQVAINHLCGYSPETNAAYTGANTIVEPDANHYVRPGTIATDALVAADSTATFDLDFVRKLVRQAKEQNIRTVSVGGFRDVYACVITPEQNEQLRDDTGATGWYQTMRDALSGGRVDDNPIITGSLGVIEGVLFIENQRLTTGVTSSATQANTRRCLLLGAQAGCIAFGKDNGPDRYTWNEEHFDFGNQFAVAAAANWGFKTSIFNSENFGHIVGVTYES